MCIEGYKVQAGGNPTSGAERGSAVVQMNSQKFWFVDNLGKISENLDKRPENPSKNDAQHLWLQKWSPTFTEKKHEGLFLEVATKNEFQKKNDFCKFGSLGKFGQTSFPPPKFCLRLWPQLPCTGTACSTFVDQSSQVETLLLSKQWLSICHVLNMFLWKTGNNYLDAIATKSSILVKPTDRNYRKEVLQILDHKRNEECHRRSGKGNNGKYFFKKQLEKKNISPNHNKSLHTETFFYLRNKLHSDASFKTLKDQRLRHFNKLTRKVISEKNIRNRRICCRKTISWRFFCSYFSRNQPPIQSLRNTIFKRSFICVSGNNQSYSFGKKF